MVTLEQYNEANSARLRRDWYALAALLVILVVFGFVIPAVLASLIRPEIDARIEAWAQWVVQHDLGPRLTGLVCLLAVLLIALPSGFLLGLPVVGVLRLIDRRTRQDRRLFCPHCDAPLNSLATLTGNCPRCGELALDLPDGGAIE